LDRSIIDGFHLEERGVGTPPGNRLGGVADVRPFLEVPEEVDLIREETVVAALGTHN
jgi:hypothetical protein